MRKEGRKYLHEVVHDTLKQEILDGVYPYDIILPSEREISLRFEVERTTVRKALEHLVDDGIVEKRAGVGTRVIYSPEGQQHVCLNDDKLVGFFIVEDGVVNKKISQPFYADLFYQVEDQCKKYCANVIYSTVKSLDDLASMVAQRKFNGVIFASKTESHYVKAAEKQGVKVAQILGYNDYGLSIFYDSSGAGFLAVDYLIKKGHNNIALITGPSDFHITNDRLSGVLLAFYQHGLVLDRRLVFEGNWEYETGYKNAMNILSKPKKRPTAIYCFNDMMALGAIQAISDSGLKIPQDISLMGNDNMSRLRTSELVLTTVDTNIPVLAKVAINYFFNTSLHYIDGMKIIAPVTLLEGDTVRNLNLP